MSTAEDELRVMLNPQMPVDQARRLLHIDEQVQNLIGDGVPVAPSAFYAAARLLRRDELVAIAAIALTRP